MMNRIFIWLITLFTTNISIADNAFYCPQNHAYIRPGMTTTQVVAACGQPLSKNKSSQSVVKKVPVIQLIYTNLNQGSIYNGWSTIYDTWSLPSGSLGLALQVDIINDKVGNIKINGSHANSMSICNNTPIDIGQSINDVYSACGSPSLINNTYNTQIVPSNEKPEVWTYQIDRYQPLFTLTFVNGELQSIN